MNRDEERRQLRQGLRQHRQDLSDRKEVLEIFAEQQQWGRNSDIADVPHTLEEHPVVTYESQPTARAYTERLRQENPEFREEVLGIKKAFREDYEAKIAAATDPKEKEGLRVEMQEKLSAVDDMATREYLHHGSRGDGGQQLELLFADYRREKTRQITKEADASGDYWVKVSPRDPARGPRTEASGYICRASELDGTSGRDMGKRLGIDDPNFEKHGAHVQRLERNPTANEVHYKDTTRHPDGEPWYGSDDYHDKRRYPPAQGNPVHQVKLKEDTQIGMSAPAELGPDDRFRANTKLRSDIERANNRAKIHEHGREDSSSRTKDGR